MRLISWPSQCATDGLRVAEDGAGYGGEGLLRQGQADGNVGALIREGGVGLGGKGDRALGSLHDGLGDRQTETGPAGVAGAGRIAAIEAIEDVGQSFGPDAVAVILNDNDGGLGVGGELEFDAGGGWAVLQGVEEQVREQYGAVFAGERNGELRRPCFEGETPVLIRLVRARAAGARLR